MRSLILPELSSDFRFSAKSCVRRTIGEILPQVSRSHGVSEKSPRLEDYAVRLRDEMKKIDAFKRELPLCMLLLRDAIVAIEEELALCRKSNAEPVLEEFIPLKKICKDEEVDRVESRPDSETSSRDKMNWMSSVQLWNSTSHPSPDLNSDKLTLKLDSNKKVWIETLFPDVFLLFVDCVRADGLLFFPSVCEQRTEEEKNRPVMDNLFQSGKNGKVVMRPLVPFTERTNFPVMSIGKEDRQVPALSLCTPEMKSSSEGVNHIGFSLKSCPSRSGSPPDANVPSNLRSVQQHQSSRKQRRCWSPDLHRQFINALQQLGGAQAATPKQIRELMQVDGLTNDEVKSHLQKYRLHSRRLLANSSSQPVGLWMPEEHCKPSQSGSPEGPFHLEGNSGGHEDEDDEKYWGR
ncbi:homeodomain-like superfamily protein [Striga asiatica]|uniref:Homeodomain-like superfamily protein n=1 Tax=Striga asiatica TaxID=4170 RepID=A0A5A7QZA9_STRAF|nr:homeodomain-like superfamily protein [Striga asiatica]